jgi:hypothetical protein
MMSNNLSEIAKYVSSLGQSNDDESSWKLTSFLEQSEIRCRLWKRFIKTLYLSSGSPSDKKRIYINCPVCTIWSFPSDYSRSTEFTLFKLSLIGKVWSKKGFFCLKCIIILLISVLGRNNACIYTKRYVIFHKLAPVLFMVIGGWNDAFGVWR